MRCKLCGENKPLIEAHIIPRCINKSLFDPAGSMLRLSKDAEMYSSRFPIGEYDKNILCAGCDNSFSPWDEYARDLLFDDFETKYPLQKLSKPQTINLTVGHYAVSCDYKMLKLFFLSVLWRMSVSDRPSFRRVHLGKFEVQIRQMLRQGNPGDFLTFPVLLCRYVDNIGKDVMIGAHYERILDSGVNAVNIGLPGYIAVIKVDNRPLPKIVGQDLILQPNKPLIIGARNMLYSRELSSVEKIFHSNKR
jgi:hypothetical protein